MLRRSLPIKRILRFGGAVTRTRGTAALSRSILSALPLASNIESLWPRLNEALKNDPRTLVVIDDDPTGCQTVYDVNVLLDYSAEAIRQQLEKDDSMFYVLTNTRGLPESEAISITSQVVENIYKAQFDIGSTLGKLRQVQIISRSDSTLRGHYPAEVQAILDTSDEVYDGTILVPAFFEGGRVTFNDVHYLTENDQLIPVGETAFAKDPHFGYKSSNLVDWVCEKSAAFGTPVEDRSRIVSISLCDIRQGGPMEIADKLESMQHGSIVIVNAVHQHDLNTFVLGLLQAESNGFNFLYRTAASFVASRAALEPRSLVAAASPSTAGASGKGGLTVVGSYVPKTTAQLNKLLTSSLALEAIEVNVGAFLGKAAQQGGAVQDEAAALATRIDALLSSGKDVVLYTSRVFHQGAGLDQTALVSKLLTETVARLTVAPSFLVAKGGVTSHDVAAHGLSAKVCGVVGQVEPGVPLWRLGEESKFPSLQYVVFPGNVGDDEALTRVLRRLGAKEKETLNVAAASASTSTSASASASASAAMPLRSESLQLLDELAKARGANKAIAAFNVYNLEGAKAVVEAAEEAKAPVMLQVHPSSLDFGGTALLHMLYSFKRSAKVPVYLHLDHASEEEHVLLALNNGVDSVMVDGSALPIEENIAWTKKMAVLAHAFGCVVEAELGRLTGEEDGLSVDEKEGKMTDPAVVTRFLQETKVDLLAVTIGNVHGKYKHPPQLDFPRLSAIAAAAAAVEDKDRFPSATDSGQVKLVLHGASGLSRELVQKAMEQGICKFNVNTDLRDAAIDSIVAAASGKKRPDVLPLMASTKEAMKKVAMAKFKLFGW